MAKTITYSPAYTLVPTYECFNHCTYCNFRADPGKSAWLTVENAAAKLQPLKALGITEILILSGEVHPDSQRRQSWLKRIYDLGLLSLEMGFYPHTNAGPLGYEEMAKLKTVNVSLGLMLEQVTPKLGKTVHRYAPSKLPSLRLQQLELAGILKIPFTTGLLLGIGENEADWRETLREIETIHQQWGHIQEVILQPYSPGSQEMRKSAGFDLIKLPEVVSIAREILSPDIALQIPPNLVNQPDILLSCLDNGANDLGGICPRDEVNPDYGHPDHQKLVDFLAIAGYNLRPRLPVYPQYTDWVPFLGQTL